MTIIDIPASLVDKYRVMDPETEDLLFDSTELKPGMIVLTAEASSLQDLTMEPDAAGILLRDTMNRWARVIQVGKVAINGYVHFTCEYADGVKMKRSAWEPMAWLVKKSSVPADENLQHMRAETVENIKEIVERALVAQYSASVRNYPTIGDVVEKILRQFDREALPVGRDYHKLSTEIAFRLKMGLIEYCRKEDVEHLDDVANTLAEGVLIDAFKTFNGDN